jgi:hypothetical protein
MTRIVPLVLSLVLGTSTFQTGTELETFFAERPLDDVVLTGQVKKVTLCSKQGDAWSYRLMVRLQAKNVGTRPVIVSSAPGRVVLYKLANSLDELKATDFNHFLWMTSGVDSNPSVPWQIVPPFEVVAPNKSVGISIDSRVIEIGELQPGPTYIELVAENWPGYSDEYVAKLTRAWSRHGRLWAHSLHTEPIPFTVPAGLKKGYCP